MKLHLLLTSLVLMASSWKLAATPPPPPQSPVPLFDGRSLDGWEGSPRWWRVEDGALVGGSLTDNIPENEFVATTGRYTNFILRAEFKLTGTKGFINSGIQIRSERVPNSTEMSGYQCDIGEPNWWGSLYDESRRNKVLAWSDIASLNPVLRRNDWNEYVIRADGARITTWINGVQGIDYHEPDPAIAGLGGRLGFQVHGGGAALAAFRKISIEILPPTLRPTGAGTPPAPPHASPLDPDEQARTFSVPPGFTVELVAAEPDGGKFVPIAFDAAGRLWTSTALEYPIDANESPAEARALFDQGGKDRILVFDTPTAPGRQKARVFAEGLAMPLGVLPYGNGAIAQYGSEIRWYRDTNGDGRADRHEVLLKGFGIEDSHLFPHQFTRAPGGWMWLAQGAFNSSQVQGPDGRVVPFNKTKMARFKPDGTGFETIGWGPCNIWGLVLDRHGEAFIQEANDQGWPVIPFLEGASYPLCGDDIPRPYAPPFPKTAEKEMGGTGLSGLALSEGSDAYPAPWRDVFFVANPITRKIQAIRVHRGGQGSDPRQWGNGWWLEHLPDFVLSSDPWFRPVALSLGPDGCLYIVDWYNQVISHNEIPRSHPERDKLRGRIWRVRHDSQPHRTSVPDLARVPEADLLRHLAAPNTWEVQNAWQKIVDRKASSLAPALQDILDRDSNPPDLRLRALWALEGLRALDPVRLIRLFPATDSRALRKELIRAHADGGFPLESTLAFASRAVGDPDRLVRQEALRALGKIMESHATSPLPSPADRVTAYNACASLLLAAANSSAGDWSRNPTFFRDFERYLARVQLERHRPMLNEFLNFDSRPVTREARALGSVIVGGPESARRLARLITGLDRGFTTEELLLVATVADDPSARDSLQAALALPGTLQLLHDQRARLGPAVTNIAPLLAVAARNLFTNQPSASNADLLVRLASGFRLTQLEPELIRIAIADDAPPARQLAAVRALREIGSSRIDVFLRLVGTDDEALRTAAINALAATHSEEALAILLQLWPNLTHPLQRSVIDRFGTYPDGAARIVAAIEAGNIDADSMDGSTLDKLVALLPTNETVRRLQEQFSGSSRFILHLNGAEDSRLDDELSLKGAFTVETWIRLEPGISNADSLLGGPGLDLNFHDSKLRAWLGAPHHDIVVATRPMIPGAWAHVAISRDAAGEFRIYLDGELNATSRTRETRDFAGLRVAHSTAAGGTAADLHEYRIWNRCRTADEIRNNANLALEPDTDGLVFHGQGERWGRMAPGARLERTTDLPPIQSIKNATALLARFQQYREIIAKPGDATRGRQHFDQSCGVCHVVGGQGGKIGPALDGAGASGDESLLRHILTPDAAMEAGYRRYRIETLDGEIHEGLLAASDAQSLTLRQPSTEDRRFSRTTVRRSDYLRGSVMPEGLLEGMSPQAVADLFTYLRTLSGTP